MKTKDWLKIKSYTHLTPKIPHYQQKRIREYVEDETNIKSHRFFPMLHYTIVDKKFQRPKVKGKKSEKREVKNKPREIYYSNHLDSHIYSYYGDILNHKLNDQYTLDNSLMDSVIAYRSIPFNHVRNKCNIDFANEVFNYIKQSEELELSAICLDVSKYFDSIDHKLLKKIWANLLGRIDLPLDHFQVFKAITKFSYLEISDIINLTPEHRVKKLCFLKRKSINSFFANGKSFQQAVIGKGLLRLNRQKFGIPQGSPISAVLSNLYLLDFDKLMVKLAKSYNGFYRRYSDDIVFVCNPEFIEKVNETITLFLTSELQLEVQENKTQRVDFSRSKNDEIWHSTLNEGGNKYHGRPLTYLGFDFDGTKIRIKQKSVSGYYRKTKRLIRRAAFYANKSKQREKRDETKGGDPWIYKSRIYRLKSHLGAKKKKIDNKVFWGNYLSYAYNASQIMKEPAIKNQLRNHWRIIERNIKLFNNKYNLNNQSKGS